MVSANSQESFTKRHSVTSQMTWILSITTIGTPTLTKKLNWWKNVPRQNIIPHSVKNARPFSAYVGTKSMDGNTLCRRGDTTAYCNILCRKGDPTAHCNILCRRGDTITHCNTFVQEGRHYSSLHHMLLNSYIQRYYLTLIYECKIQLILVENGSDCKTVDNG